MTTIELPSAGTIASVKVLNLPEAGNLTVNPENSLALVLSGTKVTGALDAKVLVTRVDGTQEEISLAVDVTPSVQAAGWGEGHGYMLETDSDGQLVIEHGDVHRDLYVSNSSTALSKADIAAIEGIDVSKVTTAWLVENGTYGSTPELALEPRVAGHVWRMITELSGEKASHWLHFERGYEYDDFTGKYSSLMPKGIVGESDLHPIVITAYGEGEKPIIPDYVSSIDGRVQNIVIKDLTITGGLNFMHGEKVIFDGLDVTSSTRQGVSVTNADDVTIRNSVIHDTARDTTVDGADTWNAHPNRIQGFITERSTGLILEGNLFDHNGWKEGYSHDLDAQDGQAPSLYSHNVYIQYDSRDVTFRDNITMRGGSFGAMIRSGGYVEDNVILDNNAGLNLLGGGRDDNGLALGNYTLFTDNILTSGAHKTAAKQIGALTMGLDAFGDANVLKDNIIAHLANPDDPTEQAKKLHNHGGLRLNNERTLYNDTILYNWKSQNPTKKHATEDNVDGLDRAQADATTIQRYAAQLLGRSKATIDDLAKHLRANWTAKEADAIKDYFQKGFGIADTPRTEATVVRFTPKDISDGVRWDNRLNWSTEDLPGTVQGDSVDLGGNWVHANVSAKIGTLELGQGGKLNVSGGALRIDDISATGGAEVIIQKAGQVWVNGYDGADSLSVTTLGGRFANTGEISGQVNLTAKGGQMILASDNARLTLADGSRLTVDGNGTRIGMDGGDGGTAVMDFKEGGVLRMVAADGTFGTIREFRSGAFGDGDIQSGANLTDGVLQIDVTGLNGAQGEFDLLDLDQIIGQLDRVEIVGLASGLSAEVQVDYQADRISLIVSEGGPGRLSLYASGNASDAQGAAALWSALTQGHPVLDDTPEEDTLLVEHWTL